VVPGGVVLVGGEPGVGKSTLLMHLAAQAAAGGGDVIYVSGEESAQQVVMRARRLGVAAPGLRLMAETDVEAVAGTIEREAPAIASVAHRRTSNDLNPLVHSLPVILGNHTVLTGQPYNDPCPSGLSSGLAR